MGKSRLIVACTVISLLAGACSPDEDDGNGSKGQKANALRCQIRPEDGCVVIRIPMQPRLSFKPQLRFLDASGEPFRGYVPTSKIAMVTGETLRVALPPGRYVLQMFDQDPRSKPNGPRCEIKHRAITEARVPYVVRPKGEAGCRFD